MTAYKFADYISVRLNKPKLGGPLTQDFKTNVASATLLDMMPYFNF